MENSYIPFMIATDPKAAVKALSQNNFFIYGIAKPDEKPERPEDEFISERVYVYFYGYKKKNRKVLELEFSSLFTKNKGYVLPVTPLQKEMQDFKDRNEIQKCGDVIFIVSTSPAWIEKALNYISAEKAKQKPTKIAKDVIVGDAVSGHCYKTSTALLQNIVAKRQTGDCTIIKQRNSLQYVDEKGKGVIFSPLQVKIIMALAQIFSTQLGRDDVQKSIDYVEKYLPFRIATFLKTSTLPLWEGEGRGRVVVTIDIPSFAEMVYSRRTGGKDNQKIRDELIALSHTNQNWKFKDDKGNVADVITPLFHFSMSIEAARMAKLGRKPSVIEIQFEDIFIWQIKRKYSLIPCNALKLWNETGINTEMMAMLYSLLQAQRGLKVSQTEIETARISKKLKEEQKDEKTIEKAVKDLKTKFLVYKETLPSLLDRLQCRSTYYLKINGKEYMRKKRVETDLSKSVGALQQIGIVSSYKETKAADGSTLCNFRLNEKWLEQTEPNIDCKKKGK